MTIAVASDGSGTPGKETNEVFLDPIHEEQMILARIDVCDAKGAITIRSGFAIWNQLGKTFVPKNAKGWATRPGFLSGGVMVETVRNN